MGSLCTYRGKSHQLKLTFQLKPRHTAVIVAPDMPAMPALTTAEADALLSNHPGGFGQEA